MEISRTHGAEEFGMLPKQGGRMGLERLCVPQEDGRMVSREQGREGTFGSSGQGESNRDAIPILI